MEINNWVDFFLYSTFTAGVVFVGIPMGINFTYVGIKSVIKYGLAKFPKDTNLSKFAKSPLELFFIGVIVLMLSAWYLFYDSGGHIYNYPTEVIKYLNLD